jgi:DNA-binding transcriptional LysR family regulator
MPVRHGGFVEARNSIGLIEQFRRDRRIDGAIPASIGGRNFAMETSWLADLRAIAETLNFSRAAARRNITQPAFGRRIRALEDWCGSALIDRSTHRLSLTPAGEIMLEAAKDVTRRLERARRELEAERAATAALTFAATHALSFSFFPSWMQGLGRAAATMPVRLLSDNMNECEKIMIEGGAQFLLCHYRSGGAIQLDEADFMHTVLATDRLVPVSARNAAGGALFTLPGSPERPVPYLAFEEKSGMGRILSHSLPLDRAGTLHLSTVFSSHLAMALKALASDGKGIAWIPHSLAVDQLGPGGSLTSAGSDEWGVDVEIVLFRPRARLSKVAELFWGLATGADS